MDDEVQRRQLGLAVALATGAVNMSSADVAFAVQAAMDEEPQTIFAACASPMGSRLNCMPRVLSQEPVTHRC
jgi:hypothetical protein